MHTTAAGSILTSRERVRRMLDRRDHDRVPRFDQFWKETLVRWQGEGMSTAPHEVFDFDITRVGKLAPQPFPGRLEVLREDESTIDVVDGYGALERRWKHWAGVPEHLGWECTGPEMWHDIYKARMQRELTPETIDFLKAGFTDARQQGLYACLCSRHSYCIMRSMIGDETMLMAMAAEPEWIADMAATITDALLAMCWQVLQSGIEPDALWVFDDLAYGRGPLCSPAMFRELIWPHYKRTADFAHAHGMKCFFHTDGDVNSYIPLFIEAGIDVLQPLEAKAGLDVRDLCPRYGDQLAFFGNINMTVAITNDRAAIGQEVASKITAGMSNSSYIYHSDHSVPPQVSWATYCYIMELVEQYGWYY